MFILKHRAMALLYVVNVTHGTETIEKTVFVMFAAQPEQHQYNYGESNHRIV